MKSAATEAPLPADEGFVVYERKRGWAALDLRELWSYRELLYFLTWRDVLVRYKQAVLGVAWAILQPLLTMIVFTVVFNKALGVKSPDPDVPYAVFSFSGLLPWQFFAGALSRSGVSLVGNANLLTKVYFPRLVIPISAVLAGLVDFAISFVVLLGLMAAYGIAPTWHIVFLPLFVAAGDRHGARRQPVAERPQRALPRRAVRHPLPGAAVDVREPGDLPDQRHPRRSAARRLRPQPHDRRHRRLSLGAARAAVPRRLHVDLDRAWSWCCSSAASSTSSAWSGCSPMWCRR